MSQGCECGICGHYTEEECLKMECKCCSNFHLRSGPKVKKELNIDGKNPK